MRRRERSLRRSAAAAQDRLRQAEQDLNRWRQRLADTVGAIEQMESFHAEYACRLQSEGSLGITAARLRDTTRFMENLNRGRTELQGQVDRIRQEVAARVGDLSTHERRALGLRRALQSTRRELQQAETRKLDRELDDLTGYRFLRK